MDGTHTYSGIELLDLESLFSRGNTDTLFVAQNHPILTPAMLFVSKLYSQAKFKVVNETSGRELKNHYITKLLNNPNFYQTGKDFQEGLQFMMIARGSCVVWAKKHKGFSDTNSLYILDPNLIKWPDGFKTRMLNDTQSSKVLNIKVLYDPKGEKEFIPLKDLMFFYDSPNGLESKNFFKNTSRLKGLEQALINTNSSLIAKDIILKTNGKELISSKSSTNGFPLTEEEQARLQNQFNSNYGLGKSRSRSIFSRADLEYKSLHIALRDLGLDESVKVDGNLIYTALHIPKDILSLEAKKTTYNNFKESMVSYIQNEMESTAAATCSTLKKFLAPNENIRIEASYDHLPVMQFYLKERWEAISLQAKAFNDLISSGFPVKFSLKTSGFDENIDIDLERFKPIENAQSNQTDQSDSEQEGEEAED